MTRKQLDIDRSRGSRSRFCLQRNRKVADVARCEGCGSVVHLTGAIIPIDALALSDDRSCHCREYIASTNIDTLVGTRTRQIQRKLKHVQELPKSSSQEVLGIENGEEDLTDDLLDEEDSDK